MGQYHKIINIDKKEYVSGWDLGMFAKHYEQVGFEGSMSDVLYILLIAQGNERRGGGDIDGHDIIGSWVGDRVAVVGDYFDEEKDNPLFKNLYAEVSKRGSGYKNIGKQLRQMLPKVFDFKFKQDFWITKEANGKEYKTYHWERVNKTKEETNE